MALWGMEDAQSVLLAALEATPVNVTIADARRADRPLVYVNSAFTRTTGYAADEVLGRNCRFLQGPDTDPSAVERLRATLSHGEAIELEILNYRKSGEPFWNALVITPVRDARGTLAAFVGLQLDVTRKRKASEQANHDAKMLALGALAGGVAHEINNLLQPMLTFPELIGPALPGDAAEERAWLALIEEHARAARAAVRSILAFSRKETGGIGPVDVVEAVERALAGLAPQLPEGVALRREGALARAERLGSVVAGSSLAQAVTNLALNAIHAMPDGGTLTVGVERLGAEIALVVSDTGVGMSDEVRARVFEPFFTTKPLGEGTGLGLALVHADVGRWGGRIAVESAPGRGSRFTLFLNIHDESAVKAA